ncbi:hypothetical protein J3Q64DRAFT_1754065 [Phycomyces blakesleeanus]|uniref:Uncharacterized protein n=1 Tax=Phycomyces blakesleeanus TaxID=4837 RepID=A0ABR3AUB5_PHYBL
MYPFIQLPATCELCGNWIPQHLSDCPRNGVHPSQWTLYPHSHQIKDGGDSIHTHKIPYIYAVSPRPCTETNSYKIDFHNSHKV